MLCRKDERDDRDGLLRPTRHWPRHCAADQRDEIAALHIRTPHLKVEAERRGLPRALLNTTDSTPRAARTLLRRGDFGPAYSSSGSFSDMAASPPHFRSSPSKQTCANAIGMSVWGHSATWQRVRATSALPPQSRHAPTR